PAASAASTTSETSLYASGASSATPRIDGLRIRMPRAASSSTSCRPFQVRVAWCRYAHGSSRSDCMLGTAVEQLDIHGNANRKFGDAEDNLAAITPRPSAGARSEQNTVHDARPAERRF